MMYVTMQNFKGPIDTAMHTYQYGMMLRFPGITENLFTRQLDLLKNMCGLICAISWDIKMLHNLHHPTLLIFIIIIIIIINFTG